MVAINFELQPGVIRFVEKQKIMRRGSTSTATCALALVMTVATFSQAQPTTNQRGTPTVRPQRFSPFDVSSSRFSVNWFGRLFITEPRSISSSTALPQAAAVTIASGESSSAGLGVSAKVRPPDRPRRRSPKGPPFEPPGPPFKPPGRPPFVPPPFGP
jgi:hypothetical protein